MIKRILFVLVAILGLSTAAAARDTYSRDASVLPQAAQSMISKNFKTKVNLVKIEKTMGRVSDYEVVLTDGTEIDFDRAGNWDNIEVGAGSSVPQALVPKGVADYVKANHKGQNIVGIDKERFGYEVELSNGIEMRFDKQGRFIRYDD